MKREEIILSLKRFKAGKGREYRIRRIGLFGSAARDRMNRDSDIDVVVELEKQDLFALIGIKQDLEEELMEPVDVVSYRDGMNDFLKNRIEKEAVYV
ncbi:MAG TPA: nucleotidyltransferase [Desulfobacteraceae bacterium]|nr:nucleotidyltransferase [Desulfobacteraceae bacterium]